MAVRATVSDVARSIRAVVSPDVTAELADLLAYAAAEVKRIAPNAGYRVHDRAAIAIVGYLYDRPTAGREKTYANSIRNSGAGAMLLPYRVHRGGSTTPAEVVTETAAPPDVVEAVYGIASGWIESGTYDPPVNPTNAAFSEIGEGLEIPLPQASANGRLLLWLEDRILGDSVAITRASFASVQMTFHADSPYVYSLAALQGHIWISESVLVPLINFYPGATIRVVLSE